MSFFFYNYNRVYEAYRVHGNDITECGLRRRTSKIVPDHSATMDIDANCWDHVFFFDELFCG